LFTYPNCASSRAISRSDLRPPFGRARPRCTGDYASSCGRWSLYSATGTIPMALSEAIIATYVTIHIAQSPSFTQ
jgi:hypothetical protein